MKEVGFIALTYVVTFGAIITIVARTLITGSRLSKKIPDQDKPWI